MKRALAIVSTATLLPGCFPYVTSYVYLDAPGAGHVTYCGPPLLATYQRSVARFAIALDPSSSPSSSPFRSGLLRVMAPQNAVVSIPQPTGYLTRRGDAGGEVVQAFQLREDSWRPEHVGIHQLARSQGMAVYHFYFVGLPPITFSGNLKLPVVSVDGVAIALPVFEFERRPYAGIVPFNC